MISETFTLGCGYGPWITEPEASTTPFAWLHGSVQFEASDSEETCLRLAETFHSLIQEKIKDKFDPAREAKILAGIDASKIRDFTRKPQQHPNELDTQDDLTQGTHTVP